VIQNVLKPQQHSGITSIKIPHLNSSNEETKDPDEAVRWTRVTDPSTIEDKLLSRNIRHFGRAQGTLLTSPELQEQFIYEGVTNAVNLLLATRHGEHTRFDTGDTRSKSINKTPDRQKLSAGDEL
jgi:hypothetical protein